MIARLFRHPRCWDLGRSNHEESQTILAEKFPLSASILALALALLTIVDGVLTLVLLDDHHFEEANPAMRLLLHQGPTAFVVGKYALTVAGLPILLIFRRRRIFFPWLRVEHILPILVTFYMILLIYQIGLFGQI
jgi:uncharacterized membrane protein